MEGLVPGDHVDGAVGAVQHQRPVLWGLRMSGRGAACEGAGELSCAGRDCVHLGTTWLQSGRLLLLPTLRALTCFAQRHPLPCLNLPPTCTAYRRVIRCRTFLPAPYRGKGRMLPVLPSSDPSSSDPLTTMEAACNGTRGQGGQRSLAVSAHPPD